jgi:hypothetical protein
MNKYLLMSAAAAVAAVATGSGVAQAATTVHLGSFCDYFVMYNSGGGLWAGKHIGAENCGNSYLEDVGMWMKGTVPGAGKVKKGIVELAEAEGSEFCGVYGISCAVEWVVSTPFGPDGTWAFLVTFSGSTALVGNSGTQATLPGNGKTAIAETVRTMRAK